MWIDADRLDKAAAYRLMISAIVPRPIAWVGTRSRAGVDNLAPFSYFMGVGSAPPLLAFSVARGRGGTLKDTARNLLEHPDFTVSVPERAQLEAVHATGAPWEEPEFDAVGLARRPATRVDAPGVEGARVWMECRRREVLDLEQVHLFVGEVLRFHVADELWADGEVAAAGFDPVARLGGASYAVVGARTTLAPVRVPAGPGRPGGAG